MFDNPPPNKVTFALVGNPNAGKTTIFNALTGARQHVGNWPGVTVEKKEGTVSHAGRDIHVVDLPGTYSLTAYSLEEIIARQFIVEAAPDVVVDVVDASNLERNLYLSVQLLEMGAKVVMALNMIDVARGRNIHIDEKLLSELLGISVVSTNGKKNVGINELLTAALETADDRERVNTRPSWLHYGTELEEEIERIQEALKTAGIDLHGLSTRWIAMKLLEGDTEVVDKVAGTGSLEPVFQQVEASRQHLSVIFDDPPEILLADARYGFISGALKLAVRVEASDRVHLSENIDKVLTHRVLGPAILFVVLYLVYTVTFQGSEPLVKVFDWFFTGLGNLVTDNVPEGLLRSLLKSGIIDGVGGVLSFTPLIAMMFLAIAILEDTGYMARIAFMLDRVLRGFGLHGASMLALMVSGGLAGGCAVPGIMATRTMKEPKERLVTILVAPLMNCGAKLPVYALLIGAFFSTNMARMMFLLTLISWSMALLAGKVIRSTVLAGPSAPFVLELPPYRIPTLRGILIHTWERTWMYVKKAGTVILAVSILLWAMMTFPGLPEDSKKHFDDRLSQIRTSFLSNPAVKPAFGSEGDISTFAQFRKVPEKEIAKEASTVNPLWLPLSRALAEEAPADRSESSKADPAGLIELKHAYEAYANATKAVEAEMQSQGLRHSIGGRIGIALETVTKPLGFDWRTNVALVGGFAAKEVVVATLGTAYSLGQVDPEESVSLSEKLKKTHGWNPLTAFTLIMFVMLYNPCITTLVVIKKESGTWRWTFFAMAYTTMLAFAVAWLVRTVGLLLNLGVS